MKKQAYLALLAVGGGLLLGACTRSRNESFARAVVPAASAAPAATLETSDSRLRGWQAGRRYDYRVKITTTVAFRSGPSTFDFVLDGPLELSVVKVSGNGTLLHVAAPALEGTSRVPGSAASFEQVLGEIRGGEAFLTLSGGRVREFAFPERQSDMATSTYREIGAALQWVPPSNGGAQYESEEYDQTGRYLAVYEARADGRSFRKQKRKYLSLLALPGATATPPLNIVPEIASSEGELRLAVDGRPERIALHDEVNLNGTQAPMHSQVAIELTAQPTGAQPLAALDWNAKFASMRRVAAAAQAASTTPVEALDSARIGGLDVEQIIAGLAGVAEQKRARQKAQPEGETDESEAADERRKGEVKEEMRLFVAATALFRQQPAAVARALGAIRKGSPAAPALIDALGGASTAVTEEALVSLMTKDTDAELSKRAANALARTPAPTRASTLAFKTILASDPFNRRAIYGLGTFSRRFRDAGDAAQARELGEFLLAKLKAAPGPASLVTVLRGIANSGYGAALAAVTPYLKDPREDVRGTAVRAVQQMRDARADDIIASHLTSDASSPVRLSAIDAAQIREPTSTVASALADTASKASDARVRYRAVELMAKWVSRRPELRPVLEKVAANDAEAQVRDRARAAL